MPESLSPPHPRRAVRPASPLAQTYARETIATLAENAETLVLQRIRNCEGHAKTLAQPSQYAEPSVSYVQQRCSKMSEFTIAICVDWRSIAIRRVFTGMRDGIR